MLPAVSSEGLVSSDTALGDWYANRITVDRQPLLLLVSSRSLLAIVTPARAIRELPDRLPGLVAERLQRLGIERELVDAEAAAIAPVRVGRTLDRSVLGSLVDFAKAIPVYLPIDGWDATVLPFVEAKLAHTPCRSSGRYQDVIWPDKATPALLEERWKRRVGHD
jgi:hypothetical protein